MTPPPFPSILAIVIYPGGKNGAGVYHLLINQMPPHECYIEPFLGSGAIMRHKRPAAVNIGLDTSAEAVTTFNLQLRNQTLVSLVSGQPMDDRFTVRVGDGFQFLRENSWDTDDRFTVRVGDGFQFLRENSWDTETTLIYCDPPYLREVRSSKDRIYDREFCTPEEHGPLLALLDKKRCMVMLSGYACKLYEERLHPPKWRKIVYTAGTRGGPRDECLWMNFREPLELHDYRYLGAGYRERERIKRKQGRWRRKLLATPRLERLALMSVIAELRNGPLPNEHGVYSDEDGEQLVYKTEKANALIVLLEIPGYGWISSWNAAHRLGSQYSHGGPLTQGVNHPTRAAAVKAAAAGIIQHSKAVIADRGSCVTQRREVRKMLAWAKGLTSQR